MVVRCCKQNSSFSERHLIEATTFFGMHLGREDLRTSIPTNVNTKFLSTNF